MWYCSRSPHGFLHAKGWCSDGEQESELGSAAASDAGQLGAKTKKKRDRGSSACGTPQTANWILLEPEQRGVGCQRRVKSASFASQQCSKTARSCLQRPQLRRARLEFRFLLVLLRCCCAFFALPHVHTAATPGRSLQQTTAWFTF